MENQNEPTVNTPVVKAEPHIIEFSRYYLVGMLVDKWLRPFRKRIRDRSKYQPHQGVKECARRLKQSH